MERTYPNIAIAFRVYPKISKPTPVFDQDKLRLVELCLGSFRRSLGRLPVKIWALLDGCEDEYEALFRRHFAEDELEVIRLDGIGNTRTFEMQIDLLLNQEEAELVYFAEDDYLYLPDQFTRMVDFLREGKGVDFVSPYDHLDYYTDALHRYGSEMSSHAGHHWRTVGSTCLTFLTTRETLRKTQSVFRAYVTGRCSDASLWFSLTKLGIWRLGRIALPRRENEFASRVLRQAWRRCGRQVVLGRRWKLWVPVPSIATHMETAYLAPNVNWRKRISDEVATSEAEAATLALPPSAGYLHARGGSEESA